MQQFSVEKFFSDEYLGGFQSTYLWKVIYDLGLIPKADTFTFGKVFIAGGCIRRAIINQDICGGDFDFYFDCEETLLMFEQNLKNLGFKLTKTSKYCYTYLGLIFGFDYAVKVQLIKFKYFNNEKEIIDDFDFTMCQFVINLCPPSTMLCCGDRSLWDLARRKMVINNFERPLSILRRIKKYQDQGFTIDGNTYHNLLLYCVNNPSKIDTDIDYE